MTDFIKGDSSWFTHDRFGMFIHFGLYSLPARHEWIQRNEEIQAGVYRKYFNNFNPDLFDAAAWAKAAKNAGMKYVVFTTKHHDGFCLFDSAYTDYKCTKTPYGKDILREIVDAFRNEGFKIGLYHSLIDWNHPDFTIDAYHPLANHPDREALNSKKDMTEYRKYLHRQTEEILTKYGDIDILWYDFSYPRLAKNGKGKDDWESEKLVELIRSIRPQILLNNRLDLPGSGDIITPEQSTPENPIVDENGAPAVWEGCQTFSGSWGYHRDEMSWKSEKQCIDMLINHVSRNGNLLMNVGPNARGEIDSRAMTRLNDFGRWMRLHSRSIYGCQAAPENFKEPRDCRYTWNPETGKLYLHFMNWPSSYLILPDMQGKIAYAQFLHDYSEVQFVENNSSVLHGNLAVRAPQNSVTLKLPIKAPDVTVPVIELILK